MSDYDSSSFTADSLEMNFIVDAIIKGRCIPFLGAGVNVKSEANNYAGVPLGDDIARRLANSLNYDKSGQKGLARYAQEYEVRTQRDFLVQFLASNIKDHSITPSPLLRVLAELPFKFFVTTNYDRLLERALKDAQKEYKLITQYASCFENTPTTAERFRAYEGYQGVIIYKIHGTFEGKPDRAAPGAQDEQDKLTTEIDESKSQLIITEDDYIEFLTVIGKDKEKIGIPNLVTKKMTPSMLLFLGYGLEDWTFRCLYKSLIESLPKHQQRKSFAIQKNTSKIWNRYWQEKKVEIVDIDLYEFGARLKQCYEQRINGT